MISPGNKLYRFAYKFVGILMILFSFTLFLSAFMFTCYATDMTTQEVLTGWDNPLFSLIGMAAMGGTLGITVLFFTSKFKSPSKILLYFIMIWYLLIGAILVLFSKTVPAADAMSVYSIAESLANNDASVIHYTESYISYYPQQVGLVVFFEILIRLWNLLPVSLPAYHFIKCLYVLLLCLIVYMQYKSVNLLWHNEKISCIYLLLAALNFPFIMYSSFVYGEIPSLAMISTGIYYLIKFDLYDTIVSHAEPKSNMNSLKYCLAILISFTLSVFLRKNSLIIVIAVVIISIMQFIKKRNWAWLTIAVLCTILSIGVLPITQSYYEHRSESPIGSGVTAMSYFAMGMQESSRGNGWYNGFNFETYQISGMNKEIADSISRDAIYERLDYFKSNPKYAADFYLHKYLSQWADGTYASRQATLATFGGRRPVFDSLYVGPLSHAFIGYCNIYQNILYLGVIFFCLVEYKHNKNNLLAYLGLVAAFGGFLFHMIWEANSRYIFVYGMLLIPYAAYGLSMLFTRFKREA